MGNVFGILNPLSYLSWVSESFRLEIGQILTWKAVIYEKSLVSDFRKTVETGVDPRLHGDVLSTVSLT